ncbi:inactive cytochrome P450 76AD1-like [Beta vulgaris subsp. vulgaris]|uniref:inactive cytochrome P450 76AD1-like n=1 Tax=Beta vulgaris subsp. vulgaris TaxID=3555 RepID=UPI0020372BCB|nr:inactive cytochrome P450 76AD1-like [Beta vulgaris subsp. vulgaris]
MEFYTFSLIFLPIVFTIIFLSNLLSKSKLPPGPKPWPIIGNIHMLGEKPHHTLTEFAKTYGPIMSLKLGSITTIVISSPEIAKEMFVKHDLAISSRSVPDGARARDHDRLSMVWLPVSAKWRELRKIATMQLFSNQQLNIGQALRQKKLEELVDYARKCCENGVPMDIGKAAFTTTLNLLSSTFFSKDLASHDSSSSQEFKDIASNIMEEGAKPNLSDFFPIVKSLDLQGILKRSTGYVTQLMELFERIIDERSTDEKDDVLGTLLKLAKDDKLSLEEVKHMLVVSKFNFQVNFAIEV